MWYTRKGIKGSNPFDSARNNQNPDKICRGFVFMRIPATFPPQSYQYVQRSYQIIEYPHRLHTTPKTTVAILVFLTLKTIICAKVSCVLFMGFPMSLLTSEHKQV